jgi:hypothetical protein
MTHFSVGDQVIVRYGKHEGQQAVVMRCQLSDGYMVKVEDGSILFFSGKGLAANVEAVPMPSSSPGQLTAAPRPPKLHGEGSRMTAQKTLQQREKELQALLATPMGREELQQLDARYHAASGKLKPAKMSVITCILVHEREQGLISR